MPALPLVPGVVRCRIAHTIGSETNTGYHMFIQTVNPPNATQIQALADAMHTNWTTTLAPYHTTQVGLTLTEAFDLGSATAPVGIWTGSVLGTRTGGYLPSNCCAVMVGKTPRRYRGGRPRAYTPAGADTDLGSPQTWSSTFILNFNNAWSTYWSAIITSVQSWAPQAALCNVSYYSGSTWEQDQHGNWHKLPTLRPGGPLIEHLTTSVLSSVVGSQRRRLRPG